MQSVVGTLLSLGHLSCVASLPCECQSQLSSSETPTNLAPVVLIMYMDTDNGVDLAVAHWWDILQLAFPHLDLADIWCLSLASKAAGEFCLDRLADRDSQHARDLLFNTVAAEACMPAQTSAGKTQRKLLQAAVEWLLAADVIPPEILALDSTRYLCISGTSYREDLLVAGLEVTYEAVVTAARKLTKDLYIWIEACESCDIVLEINHITRAACCSDEIDTTSTFLSTPDIILDHLYLALNRIGSLDPVVDGNASKNIIDLCSLPAAAEITAEAIEPLLHAVVEVFGTRGCSTINYCGLKTVDALCRLDATNRLSGAGLFGLLEAAADTLPSDEMVPLFHLPAVRQLDPAQKVEVVVTLSRAYLTAQKTPGNPRKSFRIFFQILEVLLPGIPEASCASLFKALFVSSTTTGWHEGATFVVFGVMGTPGMEDFGTAVLEELLRFVLEKGAKNPRLPGTVVAFFVEILCKCPAANELGLKGAAQLVQLARTLSYGRKTVDKLLLLRAAQRRNRQ